MQWKFGVRNAFLSIPLYFPITLSAQAIEQENDHLNTKYTAIPILFFQKVSVFQKVLFFHKISFFFLLFLTLWILPSGCGKREDLHQYKQEMESFYHTITSYDALINNIDPDSPSAAEDLLAALTELNTSFAHMASLPVPREFTAVESLALEARDFMDQAVALYHTAYLSQPFDRASADAAKEYYDRANTRAVYILQILHGEIPE